MDEYIPNARDATVGHYGKTADGRCCYYCVTCNDKAPLTGYGWCGKDGPDRIYGDPYATEKPAHELELGDTCDMCGVTFLSLSLQCQAEHDEQQERWSRVPVTHVIENGIKVICRARVY